jgi:GH24 family phage-related lysozyme (muramidase)
MKEDIIDKLAKKHKVSKEQIAKQLEMGIEVEKEHTTDSDKARKIALDHLDEVPDYYTLLKKHVESKKTIKEDLRRWFKEKWVDISKKDASGNHPPCGRSESKEKGYPKCRPSRRVSSETPETSSEMSPKEKNNAVAQKRSAEEKPREGKKPNVVSHHSLKDSIELTELGLRLLFEGKNRPTNPALWSKAKAKAKAKFKVYPSAYANGFAAKWYKAQGGGWESVNESFAKALVPALALGGAIGYGAAQHQNSKNAEQAPTSEVATENPLVANTVKPKQQAEEPTYHHDVIKKMVIEDEGIRTKPYKDTRGILTVGIGHNLEAPGSKESFRKAFGAEGDKMHKHASSGGSLTDEHVKKLFDADYDEHLERTVKMIPNLHEHPPEVQAALVSGTYRGHVGDAPTFRKHFNAGKYKQAAAEFLNRKEYKDKGTARGVIKRLERDHQIFKNYSEKQ